MLLTYKNTPLFFSSKGNGNPLILLHGFLESHKIWDAFVPDLSKDRQIICIDLPGHGRSGTIKEVHEMELMAETVKAVMDELQIEQAGLAGHSMGGYVALAFLDKYPERTKSISLINSTPEADSEERKENRERGIELVKRNKESFVSMAVSNLLNKEDKPHFRDELEEIKKEALNFSEEGIIAAMKGMKIRPDRTKVLKEFSGFKMMLAGERDPVVEFHRSNELASLCGCSLYSYNGGHLSYLEAPEKLLQTMQFTE